MSNPFVIDSNTQESSGSKYIQIFEEKDFIQDNCVISKLELSEDNSYIQVEVTNAAGQSSNKRMYLPKDKSAYADETKYNNAVKIFMGNMANLVRRYKGENYTVQGNSAFEVAKKVITEVTPLLAKKIVVQLELVESNRDGKIYTNIGAFAPFADTRESLTVDNKQKLMLAKLKALLANPVKPDNDDIPNEINGNVF